MSEPLGIIYQDDVLIAVHKPAGMLVHRSALAADAEQFLLQSLREQTGHYLYPVHRLDRPTSGIVLFALQAEIAAAMQAQFDAGQVEKSYLAVLRGYISEQTVDYALKPIYDAVADRHRAKYRHQTKDLNAEAKAAQSHFMPLKHIELPFQVHKQHSTSRYSLAALAPLTGRKHQLRRHAKHIFHPIIGDSAYGDLRQNKAFAAYTGITGLLLHSRRLAFHHPVSGEKINLINPYIDTRWQSIAALFSFNVANAP